MDEDEFIMDFEIEDDPIKKFLLHKLEEIKLNNCELQEQIDNRKGLLQECLDKTNKEYDQNVLQVERMWQKILNNKWILGFNIKNTSGSGSASDVNVVLKWDSSSSLTYTIKMFCHYVHPPKSTSTPSDKVAKLTKLMESNRDRSNYPADNEWIQTEEITRDGVIVISLPISAFVEKSKYNLTGVITYQFKQTTCQIILEDFDISTSNLFSNSLIVKNWDVINGDDEAYLSTLSANEQSHLFIQTTTNFCINVEKMLEFECRFKKVDILSKNRKYFYVDGVNSLINGSFLVTEREKEYFYALTVFTSNSAMRGSLLHYLYENIPNIRILPIKYKQSVQKLLTVNENLDEGACSYSIVSKDVLKEFGKCLEKQIEFVGEFYKQRLDEIDEGLIDNDEIKLNVKNEDYQKFRKDLMELELQSDLIYSTIEPFAQKVEILSQIE